MKRVVIFGAGAVGRGLLGKMFSEAGHYVCFVERCYPLVRQLKIDGGYYALNDGDAVSLVGPVNATTSDVEIKEEIAQADLVLVSVRVENLPDVALTLQRALAYRAKTNAAQLPIIVVENTPHAEKTLGDLPSVYSGIAECVIPEVPHAIAQLDRTFSYSDTRGYLIVPDSLKVNWLTAICNIHYSANFDFDWDVKWYFHCAFHAVVAYTGMRLGYEYIAEVMNDSNVRPALTRMMQMALDELYLKYRDAVDDANDYLQHRLQFEFESLTHPDIPDTCARVGRDVVRKIQPGERLLALRELVTECYILDEAIAYARKLAEEQND